MLLLLIAAVSAYRLPSWDPSYPPWLTVEGPSSGPRVETSLQPSLCSRLLMGPISTTIFSLYYRQNNTSKSWVSTADIF